MPLSISTKNLSIAKKFSLPSLLYCLGLLVIGVSISVFYVNLRESNTLINDLTNQKNSLSRLEANLARMNEDLVQILYLNNADRSRFVLERVGNLQSILDSFKRLSDSHDFINDRSLAEEIDPVIEKFQVDTNMIIALVLNDDLMGAKKLYERKYLIGVRQIMNFSRDALYGKSEQIDKIYIDIKSREKGFVLLFFAEFIVTFVLIYFLHRQLARQLISPVDKLYAATRVIVKKYSDEAGLDDSGENEGGSARDSEGDSGGDSEADREADDGEVLSAISILTKIDSNDEIGTLCKNFKRMVRVVEKGTAEIKLANKQLVDTQDQLIQSSKLASIGGISAGLAHELNQPLGVIKLDAQLSEKILNDDNFDKNKVISKLESIIKQVERVSKIINHLKIFSRQGEQKTEEVDVNWLIDESLVMLAQSLKISGIRLNTELKDDLPPVLCDYIQIEQVLTNLLTNARDALEGEEEKRIIVRSYVRENRLYIDVEDTGCGMPKSVIEKVFDPFFTTKDVGKGMGLGMSISYGIIKDHGGKLYIVSAPGKGTRFTMSLPCVRVNAQAKLV